MAALLTNARDFEGDEAMLRLRFYRAPPRAVARAAAVSPPIVFVVALADEHGDDASLPGVGVACSVEGGAAAADVDVVALAPNRWRCSVAPAVLVAAAAATGRCRVVARATRDDPPLRDLDVLATSAAVELGDGAEATPQFLATRHFAFRSVDAAVVEDFGAACGSHVWNAGVLLAAHVAGAELAPGLRVLEVGAGCGLAAVVAAKRGCRVLATDRGAAPPWAEIKSSTRLQCHWTVSTRALLLCFEDATRAIDSSKHQPNRLRCDRAREV